MIYHLALLDEWQEAQTGDGQYRRSTLGKSLDEVGYIHTSFAGQAQGVADAFYRGRPNVVLLTIDPAAVASEIRVEEVPGTGQSFPHIYGPLPVEAVVAVQPLTPDADGRLDLTGHLEVG